MKGKKAPKKKVKKSKSKDTEWSHEGGMNFDDNSDQNAEKPRYRKTQAKDESIRRSRFKQEIARKDKYFVKKMKQKTSFNEVIRREMEDKKAQDKVISQKPKRPADDPNYKNSKSISERLQLMLSGSSNQFKSKNSNMSRQSRRQEITDDEDDDNDIDEENEESDDMDTNNHSNNADMKSKGIFLDVITENIADDYEVNEINQVDDDVNMIENEAEDVINDEHSLDSYKLFFAHALPVEINRGKFKRLQEVACGNEGDDSSVSVFGWLNDTMPTILSPNQSLSSLPWIHKFWKNQSIKMNNEMTSMLLPYCMSYADIFLECRTLSNDQDILYGVLQHILIHTLRARDIVLKHNYKLKKSKVNAIENTKNLSSKKKNKNKKSDLMTGTQQVVEEDISPAYQDQGYTRARVLILCPFRSSAMACINTIHGILGENTTMSNTERFSEEFGPPEENEEESGRNSNKPEDWRAMFDGQNVDDDFKIGLQLNAGHGKGTGANKGVYIRLYSDFYQSDVIIASPLGIRLLLENKGKGERDFLASIEIAYVHQADILYYQNWEHVDFVMRNMNLLPTNDRGTDFARVRPYFLEGKGQFYRQLIVNTAFNEPIIQASFREFGTSLSHSIRWKRDVGDGSITNVVSKVKQVFQCVQGNSLDTVDEDRYDYFIENVLSQVIQIKQTRTLIVTPSYLDYVRVRNYLMENEVNAAYISEYSRDSEISRSRARFFHGKHDILLYSGRAHFFRRFHIRGAMNIIFYSLPETAEFYAEIVNMLAEAANAGLESDMSCITLFTKFERMALERIVGAKRCEHMLSSDKNTFMFK